MTIVPVNRTQLTQPFRFFPFSMIIYNKYIPYLFTILYSLFTSYQRSRRARQAVDPAVRRFTVALQAGPSLEVIHIPWQNWAEELHPGHMLMTPQAVSLNGFPSRIPDIDDLRLCPQREDRRMPGSILQFEEIFVEDVVVRHMAVIAGGHGTV